MTQIDAISERNSQIGQMLDQICTERSPCSLESKFAPYWHALIPATIISYTVTTVMTILVSDFCGILCCWLNSSCWFLGQSFLSWGNACASSTCFGWYASKTKLVLFLQDLTKLDNQIFAKSNLIRAKHINKEFFTYEKWQKNSKLQKTTNWFQAKRKILSWLTT